MYTCPLLVSAYGINVAYEKSLQLARRYLVPLWCVAFFCIICRLLVASSVTTAKFTLKDTRFASYQFTQEMGIKEENSLYEGFTPFYPSNLRDGSVRVAHYTLDKNKDVRYIIVSSGVYGRYLDEPERYAADAAFYKDVFSQPLIKEFAPKEYDAGTSYPFYLNNDLAKGVEFLVDYARNKNGLFSGPTIQIYKYDTPGFLDRWR
jgi:hypothetical protein